MTRPASYTFTYLDATRDVFTVGTPARGAVVLMHELPGLSERTQTLAREIAKRGYQVHLPLLFGTWGQRNALRGAWQVFCLRRELTLIAADRSSPIADWVRALCRQVMSSSSDRPVGVVGMCVTGGVGLACALEPAVSAVVASQPSLPLPIGRARRPAMGLSARDAAEAKKSRTPVLTLRFRRDPMCPPERVETIMRTFPCARVQIVPPDGVSYNSVEPSIPRLAHAVLTYDLEPVRGHPTQQALETVLTFLGTYVGDEND